MAVANSDAPARWRPRVTSLLNLAGLQNEAGEIVQADASFTEALQVIARINYPDLETCAWQMHADDLRIRGDFPGAVDAGVKALAIARQVRSTSRVYRALVSLGNASAAAGDPAAARLHFDEALGIADMTRAQSPGEVSDLSRSYANLVPLYQASVRNLIDLRQPDDAFMRAEQSKARVLMDILRRGGVDETSVITPSESSEQDALRKRLATSPAALVEYRQFRRLLYENHPELAVKSADFEAASLAQLAVLLPTSRSALLDFFFVPDGVALFVVRRSPFSDAAPVLKTYFLPDPKHTFAAETRAFRLQLAHRDLDYKAAARHLFNRLLAPAVADLSGTADWILSPDGALWELPFAALVDSSGRHLVETRTLTLVPSFTAALAIHNRHMPADPKSLRLLAFGNPLPSPVPLPDAAREVVEISAPYPRGSALVLTGKSATTAEFRAKAPLAAIVHLAAHAALNDVDPLSSSVQLGSQSLTALEMMSLHLHADMVVLSACDTALGTAGPGEGVMGMGWALSAAGASSSVLSLWKVDSAASRDFMGIFYTSLSAQPRSAALRQASLAMLRSPTRKHPFYWAAFTMQGDGR
jgi:CHAT domain-containing protein